MEPSLTALSGQWVERDFCVLPGAELTQRSGSPGSLPCAILSSVSVSFHGLFSSPGGLT